MDGYRITELGRRFGLARSTLLHYDHIGLLRPGGRTAAGYRVYSEGDLARLERICALREAGLGLADIAVLLDGGGEDTGILEKRMREIGREAASLRAQQKVLAGMLRNAAGPGDPGLDRELWLDLQRNCGLDREAQGKWHREFERRSPQGHHDFLLGLGLSEKEAVQVRMLTKNVEDNGDAMERFYELFEDLPRQGPGCEEATSRALDLAKGLPRKPRVLDIGCGRGQQTRVLARRLGTRILAIDNHRPVLEHLERDAARDGLAVETREASMFAMPFEEESFDLLWAEGAIFILGLERGMSEFRSLLAPGGILVFSEMCLLAPEPPDELRRWFDEVYPDVKAVGQVRAMARDAGYEPIGDFGLPESAWWDDYYTPMLARLDRLKPVHADDPGAQALYARCEREVRMRRRYPNDYGYHFFVLRKGDGK